MLGTIVLTECLASFRLCPSTILASLSLDIRTACGLLGGLWEILLLSLPGCFLHLDFLDVEKHRESWEAGWAPNLLGPRETLHCDTAPRAGRPSPAQFCLSSECSAQGLGGQRTLFTESGKE